jgi:NAD(P)-dependent dehydrogenase (short-subunit alcohol dehydrogenase family)
MNILGLSFLSALALASASTINARQNEVTINFTDVNGQSLSRDVVLGQPLDLKDDPLVAESVVSITADTGKIIICVVNLAGADEEKVLLDSSQLPFLIAPRDGLNVGVLEILCN